MTVRLPGRVPARPQRDVVGVGSRVPQVDPSFAGAGNQRQQILGQAHRIGVHRRQAARARRRAHGAADRLDDGRVAVARARSPSRWPTGRAVRDRRGSTSVEPWPDTTSSGKNRSFSMPAIGGLVALVERAHSTSGRPARRVSDSPTRLAIPDAASAITNPTTHQYSPSSGAADHVVGVLDVEPQHHRDHHRAEQRQHQTEHLALAAVHVRRTSVRRRTTRRRVSTSR